MHWHAYSLIIFKFIVKVIIFILVGNIFQSHTLAKILYSGWILCFPDY